MCLSCVCSRCSFGVVRIVIVCRRRCCCFVAFRLSLVGVGSCRCVCLLLLLIVGVYCAVFLFLLGIARLRGRDVYWCGLRDV